MPTVVLATRNKGKIRELSALLEGYDIEVKGLGDYPEIGDIPETGDTFEENSAIKARAVSLATGLVAMADDSGLAVDALNGAPGVYSARFSATDTEEATDERNNEKLLKDLNGLPADKRTARFVCVMVAMAPNGQSIEARGEWEGRINTALDGDNGFGYDPLFFDMELGRTSARLTPAEKNNRSHRGKALTALLEQWPAFWAGLNQESA